MFNIASLYVCAQVICVLLLCLWVYLLTLKTKGQFWGEKMIAYRLYLWTFVTANYTWLYNPSDSDLVRESPLRTTSLWIEAHPRERSSRLNTHSFSCSPSPHRQETDPWQALPTERKTLTFSTNYRKQCRVGEEEAKLQNIIHIGIWRNALSKLCQREMG